MAREVMDRLGQARRLLWRRGQRTNPRHGTVFSALGFYPVCPGADEYAVGSPLFRKAVIHLENGNTIEIDAPENSPRTVMSVKWLSTEKYRKGPFLSYSTLLEGAKVRFEMESENSLP